MQNVSWKMFKKKLSKSIMLMKKVIKVTLFENFYDAPSQNWKI